MKATIKLGHLSVETNRGLLPTELLGQTFWADNERLVRYEMDEEWDTLISTRHEGAAQVWAVSSKDLDFIEGEK